MANPDVDLNDPKNMLQFINDPIDKFNMFIKKWCPDYAHLIDSDDNDGQEIRDMIADLMEEENNGGTARIVQRIVVCDRCNGIVGKSCHVCNGAGCIVFNEIAPGKGEAKK